MDLLSLPRTQISCLSVSGTASICPSALLITVAEPPRSWQQGRSHQSCWPLCLQPGHGPFSAWHLDGPSPRLGPLEQVRQLLLALPGAELSSLSPLLSSRRYYKVTSGLMLDVGGYMKALEVPAPVSPSPCQVSGLLGWPWSLWRHGVLSFPPAFRLFTVGPLFGAAPQAPPALELAPQLHWSLLLPLCSPHALR